MHSFSILAFVVALTGQVFALNVQLGGTLGNLTAGQLLDFGSSNNFVDQANCTSQCSNAMDILRQCGTDDSCTCKNETGTAMLACEQCLFTDIVNKNVRVPTPLLGSQSALDAFVAACLAPPVNTTVMPLKMTIPPSMHGPQSNQLGTAASALTVTVGTLLGGGFLFMFSTLE